MKIKFIIVLCWLALSASECKKEDEDCHYNIVVKNSSNNKIIWGIVSNGVNGCRIDGEELGAKKDTQYRPYNWCIENSLREGNVEHIYIIDPEDFNSSNVYYDCDSIEIKNNVLKYYKITLQYLKLNNFTITYP